MKKFIPLLLLSVMVGIILPTKIIAQRPSSNTLRVYSVIGDVYVENGQQKTRLKPRAAVSGSDVLIVPNGAALNLLDETRSLLHSIATPGRMTLSAFLSKQRTAPQSLSKQYLSYLVKHLFTKESQKLSHPDCYMQSTGTSYRGENVDSTFISSLLLKLPANAQNFDSDICRRDVFPTTDMNVTFSIVSCDTGLPIVGSVPANESCYLLVKNQTEKALYVNVLDVDPHGTKYLLLPVDSAASCSHLLVPGLSEVAFKSEPFIFGKDSKDETFVLFAVEEPVDFSILMNPVRINDKKRTPMTIGMYKKEVVVQ